MFKKSAIAVAMSLTLTGTAFAATKKNDVAMANSAKNPAKVAAAKKASRISTTRKASPLYAQTTVPAQSMSSSQSSATRTAMPVSAGSTVVKAEQVGVKKASFLDKFSANLDASYYGSTIVEPLAGYQPDADTGYDSGPVAVEMVGKIGYKLTDNIKLTVAPAVTWIPNYREYDEDTDSYKAKPGTMFKPIASSIRVGFGQFVKVGGFKWNGDFRYYPCITDDLKAANRDHYLRTGQNFSFAVPNSKVTIGNSFIWRHSILNAKGRGQVRDSVTGKFGKPGDNYTLEIVPSVEYQATDRLNLSLSYDAYIGHKWGDKTVTNFYNKGTYLEPALNYDVTKWLALNPYVDIKTGNHINFDTTQWGFNAFFSFL